MKFNEGEELEEKLLHSIIEICEYDEDVPEEMTIDSELIGPDSLLGLDSLDAVEIIVMIQSEFNVRIASKETSIEVLNSLKTVADYIRSQQS